MDDSTNAPPTVSATACGAAAMVAELMQLVNDAVTAARRDGMLRQSSLLPSALARVAGRALSIAEDAELLDHLVKNDPRFGMPTAWMRYATLREAVRADITSERASAAAPVAARIGQRREAP